MAHTEQYRELRAIPVEAALHTAIQGVTPAPSTLPFTEAGLLSLARFTVDEDGRSTGIRLVRITENHRRSSEVFFGELPGVFFADPYGNYFLSINLKGNEAADAVPQKYHVEPSGFRIIGMQDSLSLLRIIKSSEKLRKRGADTECILGVLEPFDFPFLGTTLDRTEFKTLLAQRVESTPGRAADLHPVGNADISSFKEYLDKVMFVITIRGMQVNERMEDLANVKSKRAFNKRMRKVFRYVNLAERIKAEKQGKEWKKLDVSSKKDLAFFFYEYLPQNLGKNYGILHDEGLLHVYPRQGNITAIGGICDNDSITGKSLGLDDPEIEMFQIEEEKNTVVRGTKDTIQRLISADFIPVESGWRDRFDDNFELFYQNEIADPYRRVAILGDRLFIERTAAEEAVHKRLIADLKVSFPEFIYEKSFDDLATLYYTRRKAELFEEFRKVLIEPYPLGSMGDIIRMVENTFVFDHEEKFKNFIIEDIHASFAQQHQDTCNMIREEYGDEVLERVISLMTEEITDRYWLKEDDEFYDYLSTTADEHLEEVWEYMEQNGQEYYLGIIFSNDWDILKALTTVESVFGGFENEGDLHSLHLVVNRIEKQLGFSYVHPESYPELVTQYEQEIARKMKTYIANLGTVYEDPNKLKEDAFSWATTDGDDSLIAYLENHLKNSIREIYAGMITAYEQSEDESVSNGIDTALLLIARSELYRIFRESNISLLEVNDRGLRILSDIQASIQH